MLNFLVDSREGRGAEAKWDLRRHADRDFHFRRYLCPTPLPNNIIDSGTTMIQTGLIPNAHDDLVTDASYDYYGLRLATCSLDQRCFYQILLAIRAANVFAE